MSNNSSIKFEIYTLTDLVHFADELCPHRALNMVVENIDLLKTGHYHIECELEWGGRGTVVLGTVSLFICDSEEPTSTFTFTESYDSLPFELKNHAAKLPFSLLSTVRQVRDRLEYHLSFRRAFKASIIDFNGHPALEINLREEHMKNNPGIAGQYIIRNEKALTEFLEGLEEEWWIPKKK